MKPMLLRDYFGRECQGWLASEKMDGFRLTFDGENFHLRDSGIIRVPDWFRDGMPAVALDGELWLGRGGFHGIRRAMANDWRGLEFAIFDMPSAGPFAARLRTLRNISLPSHARVVEFHTVDGAPQVWTEANAICDAGGEGLVIRNPKGVYRFGERSDDVLRMVPADPAVNRRRVA